MIDKAKRLLDKTLLQLSLGKSQTLLFNCACLTKFTFSEDIQFAGVSGKTCTINPTFFLNLNDDSRKTIIKHEMWHTASGHSLRRNSRDPEIWNIACDIVINNRLSRNGDSFYNFPEGICIDLSIPDGISEEEIYNHLIENREEIPINIKDMIFDICNENSDEDEETSIIEQREILNNILNVDPSLEEQLPNELTDLITENHTTKVDWKTTLNMFIEDTQTFNTEYSLLKPNRTGNYDLIIPRVKDSDPLPDNLRVYVDVSGSINKSLLDQFATEIETIQSIYPDMEITVATFNTRVIFEFPFTNWIENRFNSGGGTDINCVLEHIDENPIQNVTVFSDMECDTIFWDDYLTNCNLLWIVVDNPDCEVQKGKCIHISEE